MPKRQRRKPKRQRAGWLPVLLVVTLVTLLGVSWYLVRGRQQLPGARSALQVEDRLLLLAQRLQAHDDSMRLDDPIVKVDGVFVRSWHLTFPSQEAIAALVAVLESEGSGWGVSLSIVKPQDGETLRLRLDAGVEAFDLHLRSAGQPVAAAVQVPTVTPRPTVRPTLPPTARGRLAILLDDGGQSLDLVPMAAALPSQVAVSVLPFLPFSSATAARLHGAGHQIWLHLPMEPTDYPDRNPGPGAVLVSMSEPDIRFAVRSALNNVPHVVGVNNHMGSRATADLRTMTWVMQEISARDLLFLDSRTTVATVAEEAARAQGIVTGRRHIFLDNVRSRVAIRRQLDEAIYRARSEGAIVAIGHLTKVTVEVLQQELAGLSARGVELVKPSELMR